MNRIAFFLNIEPQPPTVTHQEKKFGGVTRKGTPIYYDPPDLKDARALFTSKLKKFAPKKPWNCPIQLCVLWRFRAPESKCVGKDGAWKITKPDTDNLTKLLQDVMTECGFWKDDALVCRLVEEKKEYPAEVKHGILISIIDLTNEDAQTELGQ